MKKTLSLLIAGFAIAGLSASPANAADHYVSGNVGLNLMNDLHSAQVDNIASLATDDEINSLKIDHKTGINLKGAVGCDYGQFRVEGELGYQANSFNNLTANSGSIELNGYTSILSLMGNGYYDFTKSGIQPYVMAGVGVAAVRFHDSDVRVHNIGIIPFSYSDTTLAYQVGAGVAVPLTKKVKCDVSYRYFATTDVSFLGSNLSSNQLNLGVRYSF